MSPPRRILAVDLGDRRSGLAATDWLGLIRVPLETIETRDRQELLRRLVELCRERETELVVVGIPLVRDGEIGEQARRTLDFVETLRGHLSIPIETVDESASTDEAHARLAAGGLKAARRKRLADSIAALVILERYLEGAGRRG